MKSVPEQRAIIAAVGMETPAVYRGEHIKINKGIFFFYYYVGDCVR